MKYEMKVVIYNPNTPKGMSSDILFKIDCYFAHDPDTYGNGYWVKLKARGREGFENYYDLRYNLDFNPNKKIEFLEQWARSYWSGEDGAYAVKHIEIMKAD